MLAALEVQGRVLMALFLREIKTRFGEKRLGFLWAFLEPVIHVMTFVAIWRIMGKMGAQGVEPVMFLITGVIPYLMFSHCVTRTLSAVTNNRALLVFPQIQMIDFVLSRILLEFTTYSVVFVGFLLGTQFFGYEYRIENPLGVMTNFVLIWLLGGGLGLVMMAISSAVPLMSTVTKITMRIMYFTSGVFFSIDRLPSAVIPYLSWNPLLEIMHMLRADFFPQMAMKPEYSDVGYVIFVIASLWLLGFILVKRLYKYILEA